MAEPIMTSLTAPNSEAWIQVSGKPAEIFGHEPFVKGKVAGFIVSKEKAQFTIHIRHSFEERPEKDLYVEVHIDGSFLWHTYVRSEWFEEDNDTSCYVFGDEVQTLGGEFMSFGKLLVTDDVSKANASETFEDHVGTLRIKLAEVKVGKPRKPKKITQKEKDKRRTQRRSLVANKPSILEGKQAAKLPHQICFGRQTRPQARESDSEDDVEVYNDDYEDEDYKEEEYEQPLPSIKFLHKGGKKYHTTYEFRYRSEAFLESRGIIQEPISSARTSPEPESAIESELSELEEDAIDAGPDHELSIGLDLEPSNEPESDLIYDEKKNFKVEIKDEPLEDIKPKLEDLIKVEPDEKPVKLEIATKPSLESNYETQSTQSLKEGNEEREHRLAVLKRKLLDEEIAETERKLLKRAKKEERESQVDLRRVKEEEGERRRMAKGRESAGGKVRSWENVEVLQIESDGEE